MNKKLGFFLVLLASVSASSFIYFFSRLSAVETKIDDLSNTAPDKTPDVTGIPKTITPQDNYCGESCLAAIKSEVAKEVAKITPAPAKVTTNTVTAKTSGTTYIPMGTSYESTSTDWYTLNDTATYIDLINDYGADATVSWEASLKVDHGNGQVFVRLWDDTNIITVNGSEMSTVNNA